MELYFITVRHENNFISSNFTLIFSSMTAVYLDNAATTAIRDEVITAMALSMSNNFGNPSSSHSYGRSSKSIIEFSRKRIAGHFNASASEIIFTAGGTEADNLVLQSAVKDLKIERIISSKIEHHAVLHTIKSLNNEFGTELSYVRLDEKGLIDRQHLESLLQEDRRTLVSLMHVNNEVGHMIDLQDIAELCKQYDAFFHSDCVQSVGHFKIDVKETPIDFFAASAHKFNGPKGVGFCFVRKGSPIKPMIIGGEQERGLRAGTESIHNIVGLDHALELAYAKLEEEQTHIEQLKYNFIERLRQEIPDVKFNGSSADPENSTYTLVSVCLPVSPDKASMLLFQLDLKGIACSKGSACQSGSDQGSHVLAEILDTDDLDKPSLRFSFGIYNTMEEIDYAVGVLSSLVNADRASDD